MSLSLPIGRCRLVTVFDHSTFLLAILADNDLDIDVELVINFLATLIRLDNVNHGHPRKRGANNGEPQHRKPPRNGLCMLLYHS